MVRRFVTLAAVAASAVTAPVEARAPTALEHLLHVDRKTVLIASHRACWKKTSENSLDGIERCIADGIDIVEIDVRTTRDGALMLMHDETVDRTTDGRGAIADLTAADIARLHLRKKGGGASAPLTGRRVPTFDEALRAVRGRVLMNIDVKAAALDRIIDAVAAAGATADVILNVPVDVDPRIAGRARSLGIAIQPLYLQRESKLSLDDAMVRAIALGPTLIQLIFDDPTVVARARADSDGGTRPRLFVNTMAFDIASGTPMNLSGPLVDTQAVVDPDQIWGRLIGEGVTVIQTDEPWRLQAWLRQKGLRR